MSESHVIHSKVPAALFDKVEGRMVIKSPSACAALMGLDVDLIDVVATQEDTEAFIGLLWARKAELARLERDDPVKKAEAKARTMKAAYEKALKAAEDLAVEVLASTAAE